MKKNELEVVVFVSGAVVMVFELLGSRLLAPYLGTSLVVWTGVIGVVLGSLSIGYWLGGKWADADPRPQALSLILLAAAITMATLGFVHTPLLVTLQTLIQEIHLSVIISCVLLFSAPSILLGMVLPYAVRLRMTSVQNSGATVGNLYAWSTLGSITGTFTAGFFLIAYFGHDRILYLIAAALTILSLWTGLRVSKSKIFFIALFLTCTALSPMLAQAVQGADLIDIDTNYNRAWIYERLYGGAPSRMLQVNEENDSAMHLLDEELVFQYTRFFRLGTHFVPGAKRALMIGGAAYSFPRKFLQDNPNATMRVVEIDPKLTEIAQKYFRLKPDERLDITHEDARTYLNRSQEKFDVIFSDAFKSFSIPYQLCTKEAVTKMYDRLNDDGAVLLNIASAAEGEAGQFLRAEVSTLKSVFPQVYVFLILEPNNTKVVQNILLVALKSDKRPVFYSANPELNGYFQHLYIGDLEAGEVMTDNYAPVDRYMLPMIQDLSERRYNPIAERWKRRT